jgi:hypothetical protein
VPGVNPADVVSASDRSSESNKNAERGREDSHKSERRKDDRHPMIHETPHSGGGSASPS